MRFVFNNERVSTVTYRLFGFLDRVIRSLFPECMGMNFDAETSTVLLNS